VDRDLMGAAKAIGGCLVDELVGLPGLIGDSLNGTLEDFALMLHHGGMLAEE
jgi:hypothetical protein